MNVSCEEATRTSVATIAIVWAGILGRSAASREAGGGLGMPHWRSDAEATSTSAPIRYVSRNPRRAAATAPGSGPTSVPITSAVWIAPSRRRIAVTSVSRPAMTNASVEKEPTVPSTSRAKSSWSTERAMAVATNPSPWSVCTITQTAFGSVRSP